MKQTIQIADKKTLDAVANNTENILEKIGGGGTGVEGLLEILTSKINTLESELSTLTTNINNISTKVNKSEVNYVTPESGTTDNSIDTRKIIRSGRGVLRVYGSSISELYVDGYYIRNGYVYLSSNSNHYVIPFSRAIYCIIGNSGTVYAITPM